MTFTSPIPTNTTALQAAAIDGEVVLRSTGLGLAICLSLTPEAVLASLEPLRGAAEHAIRQRTSLSDIESEEETFFVGVKADDPTQECKI